MRDFFEALGLERGGRFSEVELFPDSYGPLRNLTRRAEPILR